MSGDPTDILDTLPRIVEVYCHVMVGAGLPVAMHVKLAVTPSVNVVDNCIDFSSFRNIEARNLKQYIQNMQHYC